MNFFKTILALVSFSFMGVDLCAQLDPIFTHHAQARLTVNPAYSGYRDDLTVKFLHRSQWVGFEDAPSTQLLAFHMPVYDEKGGVGVSLINDRFDQMNSTSLFGDGSYKIPISRDRGVLSFGVKAGFNIVNIALTDLETVAPSDPAFGKDISTRFLPNFGFGMLYKSENFYVGLSTPRLIQNKYIRRTDFASLRERIHYYGIMGTKHRLSENLEFNQAIALRVTQGIPFQFQIDGTLTFYEKYQFSTVLRTGDAVALMLGYHASKTIWVGYSYDWSFNNRTFLYNSGSHELMVTYTAFKPKDDKVRSRY